MASECATVATASGYSRHPVLVLAGVGIASFIGCLDLTIVNTALPDIRVALGMTLLASQWSITAFLLALAGFMVVAGRAADLYGRPRILYLGLGVFGLASVAAGLSYAPGIFLIARFFQGAGCAILYTVSASIVADAYPVERRGWAIGQLFGINGIGLAAGPVAGGVIVQFIGWRWVFLANIPLLLASAWLCAVNIRRTARPPAVEGALDLPGAFTLFVTVASAIIFLTSGGQGGTDHRWLAGIVAIIAAVALVVVELRAPTPIIDVGLFRSPAFVGSILATAFLAFYYSEVLFLAPSYLTELRQLSGWQTGLMLMATTGTVALVSPPAGRLVDRIGAMPLLVAGPLLLAGSAALQARLEPSTSLLTVVVALAIFGVGWAFILGPSTAAALAAAPDDAKATATGIAWTLHNVGGAVGLGWLGHLSGGRSDGEAGVGVVYERAAHDLLVLSFAAALLITILALRSRRSMSRR